MVASHLRKRCLTCTFWMPLEGSRIRGECRAGPPVVVYIDMDHDAKITRWPVVFAGEWCGAHQSDSLTVRQPIDEGYSPPVMPTLGRSGHQ